MEEDGICRMCFYLLLAMSGKTGFDTTRSETESLSLEFGYNPWQRLVTLRT